MRILQADDFEPGVVSVLPMAGAEGEVAGAFYPPIIEITMQETSGVVSQLRETQRPLLADAVQRVAMMHELVVEGTGVPPRPLVFDGEPARQIQMAKNERDIAPPIVLFTHGSVVHALSGKVLGRAS